MTDRSDRIKGAIASGKIDRWKAARPRRKKRSKSDGPTEAQEQVRLFQWLDAHGILAHATPNEGAGGNQIRMARLKRQGLRPGYPDVTIDDDLGQGRRVHLELKRQKGGRQSPLQKEWQTRLEAIGDVYILAPGAAFAIESLRELGYASGCRCKLCQEVSGE